MASLLRDPIATCTSALKCSSVPEFKDVDSWMHYYQKRLTFLSKVATKINDPSCCLTLQYEDLLGNTDQVLSSFQKFLGTALPLSDHYAASEGGRFKYGDNSSSITSGKILRKQVAPLQADERLFGVDQQQTIAELQGDCNRVLSGLYSTCIYRQHGQCYEGRFRRQSQQLCFWLKALSARTWQDLSE